MRILLILFFMLNAAWSQDEQFVARIVKMENESQVFVPLTGKEQPSDKLVRYLDQTYRIVPASRGMKLENGYVITTGPQSKIKIIFNNGDHMYVATNTQYVIQWKKEYAKEENPTVMTIMRGAVRAMVTKGGPRSGMKVITRNAAMGVRGTDFHISEFNSGMTQISVLRGSIALESKDKNSAPVNIVTGQTFLKKEENSLLTQITKEELKSISQDSQVKAQGPAPQDLQDLEKKATEVSLNDVKYYDPNRYQELAKTAQIDSDAVAASTTKLLEIKAPEKRKKPGWADLIDERDPYEIYRPKQ